MKQHLFLGGLLVLGLLAACTQIEQPPTGGEVGDLVTLTVQREADPVTRAEPAIPDGYKLRYILEIRDTAEQDGRPTQRIEQENGSFEFTLAQGEYDFLLWADFIPEAAELSKAKYADKYYDTQDLTELSRTSAVPDSLSECEAMDAFFGSSLGVEKTADNLVLDPVTLTRPFARINLIQKTLSLLADVRAVGLSYEETNQVFNIQTGEVKIADEVKDTLTITNNGEAFQTAEGGIFAYVYLFAPLVVDAQTELAMNLSFYRDEAATEEISKRTIPAGQPYARNYVTNLSGNYLDPEGTLEVNMDTEDYEVLEVFAVWDGVYPDVQYPDDPQAGAEATLLTAKISEGVYDITTADQLDCMAWLINESIGDYSTYTYNLKVNIDLDGESENPVKHWTPIGNNVETLFAGTFDGQGHVVKNMNVSVTIETSGNNAGGFFGGITGNAFIQYLQVEGDVSIVCDEPIPVGGKIGIAGGITGALLGGGSVAYCSFTGGLSVTASDSETEVATGGITGYLYFTKGPILNCIASLTSLSINSESTDLYSGVLVGGGAVPIAYCAWLPYSNLPDIGVGVGDEFVFSMSDPENMNELLENLDAANGVNSLDYSEVEALIKQELEPEFEWTFTPTFKWVDKDGTLRLQAR